MQGNLRKLHYTIDKSFHGKTVEAFLRAEGYTKSLITGLKKITYEEAGKKHYGIEKNGKWAFTIDKLEKGDRLDISVLETGSEVSAPAFPLPLDIVYEDEDILLLNKPAFLPSHPSPGHYEKTLAGAITHYYIEEKKQASFVCRMVHRLDLDTSGLLLVAKNLYSSSFLNEEMRVGKIRRTYAALCKGNPLSAFPDKNLVEEDTGEKSRFLPGLTRVGTLLRIEAPIDRIERGKMRRKVDFESGQDAVTNILSVKYNPDRNFSLLQLELETGRTHQIRVHLSYIGCPLLGDSLYGEALSNEIAHALPTKLVKNKNNIGDACANTLHRQALHSQSISFFHPESRKEMHFEIPLPKDMADFLAEKE